MKLRHLLSAALTVALAACLTLCSVIRSDQMVEAGPETTSADDDDVITGDYDIDESWYP